MASCQVDSWRETGSQGTQKGLGRPSAAPLSHPTQAAGVRPATRPAVARCGRPFLPWPGHLCGLGQATSSLSPSPCICEMAQYSSRSRDSGRQNMPQAPQGHLWGLVRLLPSPGRPGCPHTPAAGSSRPASGIGQPRSLWESWRDGRRDRSTGWLLCVDDTRATRQGASREVAMGHPAAPPTSGSATAGPWWALSSLSKPDLKALPFLPYASSPVDMCNLAGATPSPERNGLCAEQGQWPATFTSWHSPDPQTAPVSMIYARTVGTVVRAAAYLPSLVDSSLPSGTGGSAHQSLPPCVPPLLCLGPLPIPGPWVTGALNAIPRLRAVSFLQAGARGWSWLLWLTP